MPLRNGIGIGQDGAMPPSSRFRLSGPDPIKGAEHLTSLGVSFVPAGYPKIQVTWEYVLQDGEILFPSGMRVEPWAGTPVEERLHVGASFVRDLPMARFERAARMIIEMHLSGRDAVERNAADDIAETAQAMVRDLHPDLDPDAGAGAARRWKRLIRLAEVVQEHQAARAQGEKAPANVIAKARGVESSTVRSWLHQAKQEGINPRPVAKGAFMHEVISDVAPNAEYGDGSQ
jgi:hypothetical protein